MNKVKNQRTKAYPACASAAGTGERSRRGKSDEPLFILALTYFDSGLKVLHSSTYQYCHCSVVST